MVSGLLPRSEGHQFRPIPGLELGAPEIRLIPNRLRLADAGLQSSELAATVDAFNDGLRVAEITVTTTMDWSGLPAKMEVSLDDTMIQRDTSTENTRKRIPRSCQPVRNHVVMGVSCGLRRFWPLENPRL